MPNFLRPLAAILILTAALASAGCGNKPPAETKGPPGAANSGGAAAGRGAGVQAPPAPVAPAPPGPGGNPP
jgi:hypothetical protein